MKLTSKYLSMALFVVTLASCEMDNYDEPEATIQGTITDATTGLPMEVAQGTGNFAIRIVETSYADGDTTVVVTPQTLNVMQDGTFKNTRLFAGVYDLYPYESACYEGEETKQTIILRNDKKATVDLTVTPYFEVKWVDEPWQDAGGYLHAAIEFAANEPPSTEEHTYTKATPEKAQLFISTSVKVGTSSDSRYTDTELEITEADEGNVIELMSKTPIDYTQTLWLRGGIKAKNNSTNGIYDKYCMTPIITFDAAGVNDGATVE